MAKKLPKKLFVKWNTDSDEPFLHADTDATMLSEEGTTIQVGQYELKAVRKLVNETRLE